MKKIIIFDLDGVLFDSSDIAFRAMQFLYPEYTIEIAKELLCGNFHDEVEKFKRIHPQVQMTEEERALHKIEYSKQKLEAPLFMGIAELLESLHASGYILAVNTSAYERNCLPLLEKANIKNCFDFLATANISKSKIEKFEFIKQKYQVSNDNIIFVTDTLGDIREADAASIPTVAVTWGAHDISYFNREKHDNVVAIVDSVQELEAIIRSRLYQ